MSILSSSVMGQVLLKHKIDIISAKATSMKYVNMTYVNSKKSIMSPVSSWQTILKIKDEKHNYWCLKYKVPYKENKGIILFSQMKSSCNDTKESDFKAEDVSMFKVMYKKLSLNLNFKIDNEDYNWKFQLQDPKDSVILMNINGAELNQNKLLFLKDRDFLKGKIITCHDFDSQCEEVVKNKCSLCRDGWFSGALSRCSGQKTKYCGADRCGERGWPACPRGSRHTELKALKGCQNSSIEGFCNNGLIVFCEEGQLICR